MKQPPLAEIFARDRSLQFSSFARPHRLLLGAPASVAYLRRLASGQRVVQARIRAAMPSVRIHWRYGVVVDGFAVVVPSGEVDRLARVPGVERVWPSLTYHPLLDKTPQLIGATTLWGPTLATAGQGTKIAIVDDGIDQTHPFFNPDGFAYPPGFPKGQTAFTTPKVIVARSFPPAVRPYAQAGLPFDPDRSDHGLHVAGIAAGDNGTTTRSGIRLSGIAPRAYLGNYRAATLPSEFGLNANSPELAPKYLEQARRTLRRAYDRGERDPRLLAVLGLCECDAGNETGDARGSAQEEAQHPGILRGREGDEGPRRADQDDRRGSGL